MTRIKQLNIGLLTKYERTITKDCHHLYITKLVCPIMHCNGKYPILMAVVVVSVSNGFVVVSVVVSVSDCKEEPNPRCYRPSLPSHKTEVGQECGASIGPISCLTTCCLAPRTLLATCCSGTMTTTAAESCCSKSLKKLVAIAQPKTANCLPLLVGVTIK